MIKIYAIELTKPGASVSRFALYMIKDGGLHVVWPYPKEEDTNARDLLPCQVFFPRPENGPDKFPAYHFKVGNIGYNKLQYLRDALKDSFGDEIELFKIGGWAPSSN